MVLDNERCRIAHPPGLNFCEKKLIHLIVKYPPRNIPRLVRVLDFDIELLEDLKISYTENIYLARLGAYYGKKKAKT